MQVVLPRSRIREYFSSNPVVLPTQYLIVRFGVCLSQHAYPPTKADTLEDLARKLELDPDRLVSLVKRFNSSIVPGKDYTVGIEPPKSRNARPIDTPPFYAYPLAPGFSFTRYGVKVNEEARVIRRNNRPFENVFAAGTTMVGNILTGDEYLGCFDIPLGGFFGIVAGENLW